MEPLSVSRGLRKVNIHYGFGDKKTIVNHLIFMDNLTFFAKSNDQIDSLVNRFIDSVYTLSEKIETEFEIKKSAIKTFSAKK